MPQTADRVPDLACAFWQYLCGKAGLTPPLAAKSWRAIRRSPEMIEWRYVLAQALRPDVWPPADPLRRGPCRPAAVVAALEWAVMQRRLTRKAATTGEEALFTLIDRAGRWK